MALFNYDELLRTQLLSDESYDTLAGLAKRGVTLDSIDQPSRSFDIFLSHSYSDKKIIPALKSKLEDMGYSVYVDWITDKLLSRDEVNKRTAEVLQVRMKQSKCLIYATSENSKNSKWMPWELGYFDGIKDKMVGILPLKRYNNNFKDDFKGEEYLGLYYYIDKQIDVTNRLRLWVREYEKKYIVFDSWINGEKPYVRN